MPLPLIPIIIGGAGLAALGAKKLYKKISDDAKKDAEIFDSEKDIIGRGTLSLNFYNTAFLVYSNSHNESPLALCIRKNEDANSVQLVIGIAKIRSLIIQSYKMKELIFNDFRVLFRRLRYDNIMERDFYKLWSGWSDPEIYTKCFPYSVIKDNIFDFLKNMYSNDPMNISQAFYDLYCDDDFLESSDDIRLINREKDLKSLDNLFKCCDFFSIQVLSRQTNMFT